MTRVDEREDEETDVREGDRGGHFLLAFVPLRSPRRNVRRGDGERDERARHDRFVARDDDEREFPDVRAPKEPRGVSRDASVAL